MKYLIAALAAGLAIAAPAQGASVKQRVERVVAHTVEQQGGYSIVMADCYQTGPSKWGCNLNIEVRCDGYATLKIYRGNAVVRWRGC